MLSEEEVRGAVVWQGCAIGYPWGIEQILSMY